MGLQLLTTNSIIPVSIEELADYLRIDTSIDGNGVLSSLTLAAVEFLERETNTQISPAQYLLTLDGFGSESAVRLPRPPLASVDSIKFTDPTGAEQVLDPALYVVDTASPGRVVLRPCKSWPATDRSANCVRITFTAGYPEVWKIPYTLQQAIKMMVGHWYEHREAYVDRRLDEVPLAVQRIVEQHRFFECVE
ncbi:MAG: head-tail connector protein [Bacillota bacterium]